MVKFLDGFTIEENPHAKLTKSEIVLFAYLILNESKGTLYELSRILAKDFLEATDQKNLKKILRNLAKKVESVAKLRISGQNVVLELDTDVDVLNVLEIISYLQNSEISDLEIDTKVSELLSLYKCPFLHFIDNAWVIAYRELLEDLLASTLIKTLISRKLSPKIKIRMLNLLASSLATSIHLSDLPGIIEFYNIKVPTLKNLLLELHKDKDSVPVRITTLTNLQKDKILKHARSVFPVSSDDFILIVNISDLEKSFILGGERLKNVLRSTVRENPDF